MDGQWFKRRALHNFRQFPPITRYLEVGTWNGGSLFWVLKNLKPVVAYAIDPYPDDRKRPAGVPSQIGDEVEERWKREFPHIAGKLIRESSLTVLPRMLAKWTDSFDLVYIDGSHHGWDVLLDAACAARMVSPGGLLVFDDFVARHMGGIEGLRLAVDTLQRLGTDEYETIAVNNQVVMRRLSESKRAMGRRCLVGDSILS